VFKDLLEQKEDGFEMRFLEFFNDITGLFIDYD
jgi:hypothetical protein